MSSWKCGSCGLYNVRNDQFLSIFVKTANYLLFVAAKMIDQSYRQGNAMFFDKYCLYCNLQSN